MRCLLYTRSPLTLTQQMSSLHTVTTYIHIRNVSFTHGRYLQSPKRWDISFIHGHHSDSPNRCQFNTRSLLTLTQQMTALNTVITRTHTQQVSALHTVTTRTHTQQMSALGWNSTKLTRMAIRVRPDKKNYATLYFLCCKVHRERQEATGSVRRSTRCSRHFCHPDLRQNMSLERECWTGRHVYEASI